LVLFLSPFSTDLSFWEIVLLFLLVLVFSIFIALFLAKKITNPIFRLNREIEKNKDKKFKRKIRIKSGDEVEKIIEEINRITEELADFKEKAEERDKILEVRVRARTEDLKKEINLLENKLEAKKEELSRKVEELEKFHKLTVGREKKMIELKEDNEKLKEDIQNKKEIK